MLIFHLVLASNRSLFLDSWSLCKQLGLHSSELGGQTHVHVLGLAWARVLCFPTARSPFQARSFDGLLLFCPGHSATGDTDTVSLSKPSLKHSLIKTIQFPSPWQHFRLSIYSIWKSVARKREEKQELWKEWEIPVWGKEREGCGKKKGETDASRNGKLGWDHKRAGHGHASPVISLIS